MVKNNYFFVGKDEVLDWQVIGHFFRTVDIPLNRASNISSYRAFKKAEARIKNGATLIIFPEGAISHEYPPVMVPFKNGPFRLAIEQKVPIIPVSSLNIWKIFFYDGMELGTRPGVVKIHTHKIIHTDNLTLDDVDALREQVYGIINEKIDPYIKATEHIETMPKSPYTY
jgi:1-acyl-sn-glycerol-3-phosphate acyltransferase